MSEGQCLVFACEEAFTPQSWSELSRIPRVDRVVKVSRAEAMDFALNWVEVNDTIIFSGVAPQTVATLEGLGKTVISQTLDEFKKAGGSAACLVARVHDFRGQH